MSAPMARWTNTTTWEDLLVSDQRKAKIPLHRQSTSVARQLQRPARTIVSQQHTLGDMSSLSIGKESSSLVPEAHGVVLKPRHSLTEERRRQSALMKQRTMGSIHDTSLPSRLLARISKDLSLGNGALHRSDTLEKGPEVKRSAPSYLDPEHLRTLLGEVEPDMASMTSDVASVVKFLFDAADTNKDGYISYSDMRALYANLGGALASQLDIHVSDLNTYNDAQIDFAHFLDILLHMSILVAQQNLNLDLTPTAAPRMYRYQPMAEAAAHVPALIKGIAGRRLSAAGGFSMGGQRRSSVAQSLRQSMGQNPARSSDAYSVDTHVAHRRKSMRQGSFWDSVSSKTDFQGPTHDTPRHVVRTGTAGFE